MRRNYALYKSPNLTKVQQGRKLCIQNCLAISHRYTDKETRCLGLKFIPAKRKAKKNKNKNNMQSVGPGEPVTQVDLSMSRWPARVQTPP